MREIRQSGSEGGEAEHNRPSLPLSIRLGQVANLSYGYYVTGFKLVLRLPTIDCCHVVMTSPQKLALCAMTISAMTTRLTSREAIEKYDASRC